jgi:hypothetical protein
VQHKPIFPGAGGVVQPANYSRLNPFVRGSASFGWYERSLDHSNRKSAGLKVAIFTPPSANHQPSLTLLTVNNGPPERLLEGLSLGYHMPKDVTTMTLGRAAGRAPA